MGMYSVKYMKCRTQNAPGKSWFASALPSCSRPRDNIPWVSLCPCHIHGMDGEFYRIEHPDERAAPVAALHLAAAHVFWFFSSRKEPGVWGGAPKLYTQSAHFFVLQRFELTLGLAAVKILDRFEKRVDVVPAR